MAAKHLLVASELGLFEKLAQGPSNIQQLSERMGISKISTRIIADAMVALGLLEKQNNSLYRNGPEVAAFLSGTSPRDLRPALRLMNNIAYLNWANLEKAIRSRQPSHFGHLDKEQQKIFSEGVEAFTAGAANHLADSYDFRKHKRVLDIGGGTGSFLLPLLRQYNNLEECALFELSDTAQVAKIRLGKEKLGEKVRVIEGDFMKSPIPSGYDLHILANVIHILSPEHVKELLSNIRRSVEPGTRLLLVDFWTDPTHTNPVMAAMYAGEFLVMSGEGDVYSVEDVREWLQDTGWKFVDHKPLTGPQSLVVAEAID